MKKINFIREALLVCALFVCVVMMSATEYRTNESDVKAQFEKMMANPTDYNDMDFYNMENELENFPGLSEEKKEVARYIDKHLL